MIRTTPVRVVALLAMFLMLAAEPLAAEPSGAAVRRQMWFSGTTSQGAEIFLSFAVVDGKRVVRTLDYEVEGVCQPSTLLYQQSADVFFGKKVKVLNGAFNAPPQTLAWDTHTEWAEFSGSVAGTQASGTMEFMYVVLTPSHTAELCSTGPITWTATHSAG